MKVLRIQVDCRNWADIEGRLLEWYIFDDSLRLLKKDFMDWVDSPGKGRNLSTLLQEFESLFTRLSTLDRTVLDTSKVLLFVKSFDFLIRDNVGLLLETNEGLTVDLAMVKEVCGLIDKWRNWTYKGSSVVGPTAETRAELAPTQT